MSYREIHSQVMELINQAEKLLKSLEQLKTEPDRADRAAWLLNHYRIPVQRAIRACSPGTGRIRWLLASGERKQRAFSACNYLFDCLMLGLGKEAEDLLKKEKTQ